MALVAVRSSLPTCFSGLAREIEGQKFGVCERGRRMPMDLTSLVAGDETLLSETDEIVVFGEAGRVAYSLLERDILRSIEGVQVAAARLC